MDSNYPRIILLVEKLPIITDGIGDPEYCQLEYGKKSISIVMIMSNLTNYKSNRQLPSLVLAKLSIIK